MGNTQPHNILPASEAFWLSKIRKKVEPTPDQDKLLLMIECHVEIRKAIKFGLVSTKIDVSKFAVDISTSMLYELKSKGYCTELKNNTLFIRWFENDFGGDECPVCFEDVSLMDVQTCGHRVHFDCNVNKECPLCKL